MTVSSLPLFREEAFSRFRMSPWQPPLLSKPLSGLFVATLAMLGVVALIAFATTFKFARKELAMGHLTPVAGWSRVTAQSFAVVHRRFVEAGDVVKLGDVLYELASGDGLDAGVTAEAKMLEEVEGRRAALESQLATIQSQFENEYALLHRERKLAERQARVLETEIGALSTRLEIARKLYEDGRRLKESGALPAAQLLKLADDVQSRSSMLAAPQRRLARLQADLESHEDQVLRLELNRKRDKARILEQNHSLAMEESRLRVRNATSILAPRGGKIASVRGTAGDWLRPGESLLDIVPEDSGLKARLFATSAAMGTVEIGQDVRIYLDAFPYEKHGAQVGLVSSISETTLRQGEAPALVSVVASGGPVFQIDVEFPDGFNLSPAQQLSLRPGMTISADLVTDYGTLFDWLLEPLRGAASRL